VSADPFYRDKAERHAPKTPQEVTAAAKDLAASGFSDYTVAAVLKLDVNVVRQMIGRSVA
jgi:hypothetical protein